MEYFKLRNGMEISCVGMGTYPISTLRLMRTIPKLYGGGINFVDSASDYKNERIIGLCKLLSGRLLVSTKLSVSEQRRGPQFVETALKRSMRKLNVKKLDMYLLHFPYPDTYLECWHEMERLYKAGLVGAIGVCNCNVHHLKNIMDHSEIKPFINEIELHPYLQQNELVNFCKDEGIQVISYSPFARNLPDMIYNPVLREIANKYGKSVNQIILRWNYQRGVISIPQISSLKRLAQNTNIFDFEITQWEMNQISELDKGFRIRFNPDTVDYNDL